MRFKTPVVLLAIAGLLLTGPLHAQFVPAENGGTTSLKDGEQEPTRTQWDGSLFRIAYITPWLKVDDQGKAWIDVVLGFNTAHADDFSGFGKIVLLASTDDQVNDDDIPLGEIKIGQSESEASLWVDPGEWPTESPEVLRRFRVDATTLAYLGRGSLVIGAKLVSNGEEQTPVYGDVALLCAGFDAFKPIDLRIIHKDDDVVYQVTRPDDYYLDVVEDEDIPPQQDRVIFSEPSVNLAGACEGTPGSLTLEVNQKKPDCKEDEAECSPKLRCSAGVVAVDIWWCSATDGSVPEADIAQAIDQLKRANPFASEGDTDFGRLVRVYTSPVTPRDGDYFPGVQLYSGLSNVDQGWREEKYTYDDPDTPNVKEGEAVAQLEAGQGELGDSFYGVWGYWDQYPVSHQKLYNLDAPVDRNDKLIASLPSSVQEIEDEDTGGRLVLFVYQPSWYGLFWKNEDNVDTADADGPSGDWVWVEDSSIPLRTEGPTEPLDLPEMEYDLSDNVFVYSPANGAILAIPGYDLTLGQDIQVGGAADQLGPVVNALAGETVEVNLTVSNLGTCGDDVSVLVTYTDPDDDTYPDDDLAGTGDVQHEYPVKIVAGSGDATTRGIVHLEADGSARAVRVILPSSIDGAGYLNFKVIPREQDAFWDQGLKDQVHPWDIERVAFNLQARPDLGIANYENFPWPDPFFQKKGQEYTLDGVKIDNHGKQQWSGKLEVVLTGHDPTETDELTGSIGCPSDIGGRQLLSDDLTVGPTERKTTSFPITLPSDLHADEQWVVVRLTGLDAHDGNNANVTCVAKQLGLPRLDFGLENDYTVYSEPGKTFPLTIKTGEGGPGFTADVRLEDCSAGEDACTPASAAELNTESAVTVADSGSVSDQPETPLTFSIGAGIDPWVNHIFKLTLTTNDLFAEPMTFSCLVSVELVQAAPGVDGTEKTAVVPVLARIPTQQDPWYSRLWFFNQQDRPMVFEAAYVVDPRDGENNKDGKVVATEIRGPMMVTRRLALDARSRPGSAVTFEDCLKELFGVLTYTKGWAQVRAVSDTKALWPEEVPLTVADIYHRGNKEKALAEDTAPRGQFISAVPAGRLATGADRFHVTLVPMTTGYVNIHITNFSDQPASFVVRAYDSGGVQLHTWEYGPIPPGRVFYERLDPIHAARLSVEHVAADAEAGRFAAVVSQVDKSSGDAITLASAARGPLSAGGSQLAFPVVAKVVGANGSNWYTSLTVANVGDGDASLRMVLYKDDGSVLSPQPVDRDLAPGQSLVVDDVWTLLSQGDGSGKGKLVIDVTSADPGGIVAASRIYTTNSATSGTLGQQVQPVSPVEALVPGGDAGVVFALDLDDAGRCPGTGECFRENLGVAALGSDPATVVLRLLGPDGDTLKLLSPDGSTVVPAQALTVTLRANQLRQFNNFDALSCAQDETHLCVGSFFADALAPATEPAQNARLYGAVLEAMSADGKATVYLSKVSNESNDALYIPLFTPNGYGTALPDSTQCSLEMPSTAEIGEMVSATATLKDSDGRPLGGYLVTLQSDRPSYFCFDDGSGPDGGEGPFYLITDDNGQGTFRITSHGPGDSNYSLVWAVGQVPGTGQPSSVTALDLNTTAHCRWEARQVTSAVAETSVVGRNEQLDVTIKEADGSPMWPGFSVTLVSDRPEDTPSDTQSLTSATGSDGVASFQVGTSTIGLSLWHAELPDHGDGYAPLTAVNATVDDQTLWSLDESASTVVVGNATPTAGPTDGSDCNGDGQADTGDTLEITVTLMGENNQPVVNANVSLDSTYDEDVIQEAGLVTDSNGQAVFHATVPPVAYDPPITAEYVATASPNSGTSSDPVQTVDTTPAEDEAEWEDLSAPSADSWAWTLQNGFLTESAHDLALEIHECIGHVNSIDVAILRTDDGRYWNPGTGSWDGAETWFQASGQPVLDSGAPANTWDASHNWETMVQDYETRLNSEGFSAEWLVRPTDGGGNQPVFSAGAQLVDFLAPTFMATTVTRENSGAAGEGPVANEGFDITSTFLEYNPATAESRYRVDTLGSTGSCTAVQSTPIGTPDQATGSVTTGPVTVDSVTVAGDQRIVVGGAMTDPAGHLVDVDCDPANALMVYVKPLAPADLFQGLPDPASGTCSGDGLAVTLIQNSNDPAAAREDLQYAFRLDGIYWLSLSGSGALQWSTNGPTYLDAAGWGLQNWNEQLVLPKNDDSATEVMSVIQDHAIEVFAHNPWDTNSPAPGADNTVSDPLSATTEGVPEVFVASPPSTLYSCDGDAIQGTFSDDDGTIARVEIRVQDGAEYFDGSSWGQTEQWFQVRHDNTAHTWTWDQVSQIVAMIDSSGRVGHSVGIWVRALDDEGTAIYSCAPSITVTLGNQSPTATIESSLTNIDEGQSISGTISDAETACRNTSDYPAVELRIYTPDQGGQYWNGASWQGTETWFHVTVTDWANGTWSYTLPAGFHAKFGGSSVTVTVRATDDLGGQGTDTGDGNIANSQAPTIQITSSLTNLDDDGVISGTLTDDSQPGGSTNVDMQILAADTGEYWNGTSWQSGAAWFHVSYSWNDGTWSYTLPAGFHDTLGGSPVTVTARATDRDGQQGTDTGTGNIANSQAPTIQITSPLTDLDDGGVISGTLSDDSHGVAGTNVEMQIVAADTGEYWNGTSWQSGATWFNVGYDWNGGTWSYTLPVGFHDTLGGSSVTVTVQATDRGGLQGTDTGTGNIANLSPMVQTAIADQTNNDGDAVSLGVSGNFSDPDGDTLTYSASSLPTGLSIDSTTGIISGTIDASASASSPYTAQVTASDAHGASVTAWFTWTVNNPAPTTTGIADQTNNDGDAVSVDVSGNFSDPDGDTLTYSASSLPTGLSIDPSSGVITGTIAASASASSPYAAQVTATDTDGASVTASFTWTVNNPAPVVTIDAPSPMVLGDGVTLAGTVTDDDAVVGLSVLVVDTATGQYWDESTQTWSSGPVANPATVTGSAWSLVLSAGFQDGSNGGDTVQVTASASDAQTATGITGPVAGSIMS